MRFDRCRVLPSALLFLALGIGLWSSPAGAELIEDRLTPTSGTNQADLTIDIDGNGQGPFGDTSFVQAGSTIDVIFDTVTRDLEFESASIVASDVFFETPGFPFLLQNIEALNIQVVQDLSAPITPKVRIEENGDFMSQLVLPVFFSALVRFNGGALESFTQDLNIFLDGRLSTESGLVLEDLTGEIPEFSFEGRIGENTTFTVNVSGTVLFNFAGAIFKDGFEDGDTEGWDSRVP